MKRKKNKKRQKAKPESKPKITFAEGARLTLVFNSESCDPEIWRSWVAAGRVNKFTKRPRSK